MSKTNKLTRKRGQVMAMEILALRTGTPIVDPINGILRLVRTTSDEWQCNSCGYIARTTKTNITNYGPTICPCNHQPMETK